jgi:hypothetical protein
MSKRIWIKRTVGLSMMAFAAFAVAGPKATAGTSGPFPFTVSTTVDAACTLTTANLTFPNYTTGTAFNVSGSTGFTVNCPGVSVLSPTPVTLTMTDASSSFVMTSGANTLNYSLCNDAACGTRYAIGVAGPVQSITTTPQTYTLFGQIPLGQAPPPGAGYQQVVNATLTY